MKVSIIALAILISSLHVNAQGTSASLSIKLDSILFSHSLVDFDAFEKLAAEVRLHRQSRLITLDSFLKLSKEKKVLILDTRSESMYNAKHIQGAIHLNFSDFTQANLARLIPDPNTKILIYCNNNFKNDQIFFASKMIQPGRATIASDNEKPLTLALNIPTYINLYGYGYKNVYELSELVSVTDPRIKFEGTNVIK